MNRRKFNSVKAVVITMLLAVATWFLVSSMVEFIVEVNPSVSKFMSTTPVESADSDENLHTVRFSENNIREFAHGRIQDSFAVLRVGDDSEIFILVEDEAEYPEGEVVYIYQKQDTLQWIIEGSADELRDHTNPDVQSRYPFKIIPAQITHYEHKIR